MLTHLNPQAATCTFSVRETQKIPSPRAVAGLLESESFMESIRCSKCQKLLFKAAHNSINGTLEIKCHRCKSINHIRPMMSPEKSIDFLDKAKNSSRATKPECQN